MKTTLYFLHLNVAEFPFIPIFSEGEQQLGKETQSEKYSAICVNLPFKYPGFQSMRIDGQNFSAVSTRFKQVFNL